MLDRLIGLYSKNSNAGKTPLEDFTTEAFAGILEHNEEVKKKFVNDFLKLPQDDYRVLTQKKYPLNNRPDCIIDMVLRGTQNICFIENKVNSLEHGDQLSRYCDILDGLQQAGYETYLFYCTKYVDKKEITEHDFKQYRWKNLSTLLGELEETDSMIIDFLNFLSKYDMAKDNTIYSTDFITFESIQRVLNHWNDMLDSAKPEFAKRFASKNKISDGRSVSQILKHNRLIYYISDFVIGAGWSELGYGLSFEEPCIYDEVYINSKNENCKQIIEAVKDSKQFFTQPYDHGVSFWLQRDLSDLLNKEDSETIISKWFNDSFEQFDDFMQNEELNVWNR